MKRDELERYARELYTGCPGCGTCIHCTVTAGDDSVDRLMDAIDQYVDNILAALGPTRQQMWSAKEVADYLGLSSDAGARTTMSRHKIRSTRSEDGIARYPAKEVRAIREARKAANR